MEVYPHTSIPRTSFNVVQLWSKMGELKIGYELVFYLPGEKIHCISVCVSFQTLTRIDNLMSKLIEF
jgi:hypothetical protein